MLTIPQNSLPFVNHVAYFFDGLKYPNQEMKPIENYNAEEIELIGNITQLTGPWQTSIYDSAANISHWIALTGILNAIPKKAAEQATQVERQLARTTQNAIRDSALHRLKQLGVAHSLFRNPIEELMEHVFTTAYENASPERKDDMIGQMAPLTSYFESTSTRGKRVALKATLLVTNLLQNRMVQIVCGIACAIAAIKLYVFIAAYFSANIVPLAAKFLMTHAGPVVVKVLSQVLSVVDIIARNQFYIFIASCFTLGLMRYPRVFRVINRVFSVLLAPLQLTITIYSFFIRAFIGGFQLPGSIARPLQNIQNRGQTAIYLEHEIKGRALWLHLTAQNSTI